MKIIIFGSSGQLGITFTQSIPEKFEVITPLRSEIDLSVENDIKKYISQKKPKIILNFAAFTDVDGSEKNPRQAFDINSKAPCIIAKCAKKVGAIFIHISTDYVYSGFNKEYFTEESEIKPKNIYGKSKALGEKLIRKNCRRFIILRTSWLYSNHKINFFTTISKLIKTRDNIRVVNDQIGSPTLVNDVVSAVLKILDTLSKENLKKEHIKNIWGIYNLSNSGETSWYGFASVIANKMGYNSTSKITPVNSREYNSIAHRPLNSRLDNSKIFRAFGIRLPNWEDSFNDFFENRVK